MKWITYTSGTVLPGSGSLGHEYLTYDGLYIKDGNFHKYKWNPIVQKQRLGEVVKGFGKDALHLSATLVFVGSRAERMRKLNDFRQTVEADVWSGRPGVLSYGFGQKLDCYIIESSTYPDDNSGWTLCEIDIYAPRPFWYEEARFLFQPSGSGGGSESLYLDYTFDYSYDYKNDSDGSRRLVTNHYAPSQFEMTIFGPANTPMVFVNGHRYGVYDTIYDGELLTINSRRKTITKILQNGQRVNDFDLATKDEYVFEPIPGGNPLITWNGSFTFELLIYKERSEPEWRPNNIG